MSKETASSDHIRKFLKLVLFYLLFVLLNIVVNRLVGYFGLPLFIDNIGTLLAAILGGYLPGIMVGYVTNIVNATADPANAYYAVLSVLIAVSGTFLSRRGFFDKFSKMLLTIPVFAFIGGFLGSILTYLLYGFGMGEGISAPFAAALLERGTLSVFWAQMISDVTIDLVDKAITVTIVFALLKVIPEKFGSTLALTNWKQKPLTKEEIQMSKETNTKGMSLRAKIIGIIGVIMLFIAFVTTTISYVLYKSFAIEQYTYTGKNVACLVASTIDADRVNEYLADAEAIQASVESGDSSGENGLAAGGSADGAAAGGSVDRTSADGSTGRETVMPGSLAETFLEP